MEWNSPDITAVTLTASGERRASLVVPAKEIATGFPDVTSNTTAVPASPRKLLLVAQSREPEPKVTAVLECVSPSDPNELLSIHHKLRNYTKVQIKPQSQFLKAPHSCRINIIIIIKTKTKYEKAKSQIGRAHV